MGAHHRIDPWKIIEAEYRSGANVKSESLFSISNEIAGVRGNFEEGVSEEYTLKGSYFNGVFERIPLNYLCPRKGWTETLCFMVNNIHWLGLAPSVDGEKLDMAVSNVSGYSRDLDMYCGLLTRKLTWHTKSGREIKFGFERFMSMTDRNLAAIRVVVEALEGDCEISFQSSLSALEPHEQWGNTARVFENGRFIRADKGVKALKAATLSTQLITAVCALLAVNRDRVDWEQVGLQEGRIDFGKTIKLLKNKPVIIDKHVSFFTSLEQGSEEILRRAVEKAEAFYSAGYEATREDHKKYWVGFWKNHDIKIEGDDVAQQGIRFNIFQLNMAYSGCNNSLNIAPKGMTGENYLGAVFWDTEAYCLPYYLFTEPQAAKRLLLYRYNQIDAYRKRAAELGYEGMKVPWATLDGSESTPGGDISLHQLHNNTIVIYALWMFSKVTGEKEFLSNEGLELLVENARFWASRCSFSWRRNKYVIPVVIGPDEFRPYADNNAYTNAMVKFTVDFAVKTCEKIRRECPEKFEAISKNLKLNESEICKWRDLAENIFIQEADGQLGIIPQDDTFLDSSQANCHRINPDERPIYVHWPYDRLLRTDVVKQPDVLLGYMLLSEVFCDTYTFARCFRYYEPRTTHDSSLSSCVHAVLAAELGIIEKAYGLALNSIRLDLDDRNKNVEQGLHVTAMGGAWMVMVMGFGGLRWHGGEISLWPVIPGHWDGYEFKIYIKGAIIKCSVKSKKFHIENIGRERAEFKVFGELLSLSSGEAAEKSLKGPRSAHKDRAALFDLDGVLADSDKYHYKAWKFLAEKHGVHFDREINHRLRGVSRMRSLEIILEKASRNYAAEEKEALAKEKNEIFRELIKQITPADLALGAERFLKLLKKEGWPVALCSSSKNAREICEKLNIIEYFDAFVDGNCITRSKPHPEIFLKAAGLLGVYPGDCVVFEDAQSGIDAAKNIGAVAVGVCSDDRRLEGADINIKSFVGLSLEKIISL